MDFMCRTLMCLLFVVLVVITNKFTFACSNIFVYNTTHKYGTFELNVREGINTTVEVHFDIKAQVSNKGSLKFADDTYTRNRRLTQGKPTRYILYFPPYPVLPKVKKIIQNNRIICTGPSETPPSTEIIHTKSLDYPPQYNIIAADVSPPLSRNNSFCPANNFPISRDFECGKADVRLKVVPLVVNGEELQYGSWPWLVAVFRTQLIETKFICGGTLISTNAVISSGHCFFEQNYKDEYTRILLALGWYNIEQWTRKDSQLRHISKLYVHEDYLHPRPDADLALLILEEKVLYNFNVRPACFLDRTKSAPNLEGQTGTVAGWGLNENKMYSKIPMSVNVSVVLATKCALWNSQIADVITRRSFCAGDLDGKGPCLGDSGSGLMINFQGRWALRGVVAQSLLDMQTQACNLKEYVIYTDVEKFRTWIEQKIGEQF